MVAVDISAVGHWQSTIITNVVAFKIKAISKSFTAHVAFVIFFKIGGAV